MLQDLLRHQADLSAPRMAIDVESLSAGHEAVRDAVDSASRLLQSIDQALARDINEPER